MKEKETVQGKKRKMQTMFLNPEDVKQARPMTGYSSNRQVSSSSLSTQNSNKSLTNTTTTQYQDTSVERLIREVTSDKFWHHPGLSLSVF